MNKLIFSNVILWERHLSEMLEIFFTEKDKNNIFLLSCNEYFYSCPANNNKKKNICKKCLKQKNYLTNKIMRSDFKEIKLNQNKEHNLIPEFKSINEFIEYKYDNFLPAGQFAVSTLLSQTQDLFTPFSKIKKKLYSYANNSINFYNDCIDIIDKYKIDETYTWNGRRISDGPLSFAAKKRGKKFFSYISGGNTKSYILQPTEGIHDLSYTKNRIKKLYEQNSNNLKSYEKLGAKYFKYMRYGGKIKYGMMYFNEFFDKKKNIFSKEFSNKKKLTIFTSSEWENFALVGKEWRYKNGYKIDSYKSIKSILNDQEISKIYDISVRWHPNLRYAGRGEKDKIKEIVKNSLNINHFDYFSNVNSYNLIDESDVILSFGSQIGVEATYYEKPSICMGSAFYEDTGAVYTCVTLDELKNIIFSKNLKALPKINAIKFGYHEEFKGEKRFNFLKHDKHHRWFLNNQRILYQNFYDKILEILKLILKKLNLYNSIKILLSSLKIINIKSFEPKSWNK